MKHWISLVNVPEVDQYVEIAKFAEEVGYYGITVADHLVMPTNITESKYPYTPDGEMWWPIDTPWPDPWISITAMGVATKNLRLATNIYLAAMRDPFTSAKAIATASVLTEGRVVCGVSVGWIKEEHEMLGVDFHTRGKRLDETIDVMKKLWTGEDVSHKGKFFNFEHALMSPKPHGKVPVWSGGASKPALRRAAQNDGWLGIPMMGAQLEEVLKILTTLREEMGKGDEPFDICASLIEPLKPPLQERLEGLGVQNNMVLPWVVTPWGRASWLQEDEDPAELDVKKRTMERFANKVIHRKS